MTIANKTKRGKLTDVFLDDKITEEVYQQKCDEIEAKLTKATNEQHIFEEGVAVSENIEKRMKKLRGRVS